VYAARSILSIDFAVAASTEQVLVHSRPVQQAGAFLLVIYLQVVRN
jgi:hypothetical protein